MFRTITKLSPTIALGVFRHSSSQYDKDLLNRPNPSGPETGWDRVKQMYTGGEFEEVSEELNTVLQSSLCGAFIGACMGGFVSSRVAYLNFIENNQATIFKSTAAAKKQLQNYVTVAFAKGAYKWGWRLCFFTGIFSLTSTTISVYRGDTSLIEFVSAGALTGALYKIDMGLAATLVGAGLGTALSFVAGITILGILKVTGVDMIDIRKALYKLKEARDEQFNQALEKSSKQKYDSLTDHHTKLVIEEGEKKIEEM
ncbi:RPII140-upstream gene protein [Spodoptera litura]|uniref:Complex I assembly factor TIMMDC1, mitochondrial n=1 Tax=Spodoptera litura TaxID=69820 RepID=A0A9J7DQG3_SPOLT|nr:RPII140-upstream gene protein [Spodoptera litura]